MDAYRPAAAPSAGGLWARLYARQARPLRFAITGGVCGLFQLALLALLTRKGGQPLPANGVAFLAAAQLNFALSSMFTWRDRRGERSLIRRWLAFHGSIAGMAVVNLLVFTAMRPTLPDLPAAVAGIGVAAIGNFIIGDRLVFRVRREGTRRTGGWPGGATPSAFDLPPAAPL